MTYKYVKQISIGYDTNGRRIRKRIYANSEQELKRKEKELLQNSTQELQSNMKFKTYADLWFKTYKSTKATRTQEYYESGLKKLSDLDGLPLSKITQSQIQNIITANRSHPRTCKMIYDTISQIYKRAIADGLVYRNPAIGLDLPDYAPEEQRILTDAEKTAARNADLPEAERLFLDLVRLLGLRPEEARALSKSAIDFKEQTITISQAVIFNRNSPELKGTKNGKVRTLPLQKELISALRKRVKKFPFILFPNSDGEYMTKMQYRDFSERIFSEINKKLGGTDKLNVLNGMTFYNFRHSKGTELYYLTQQGKISTKLAAQYMGHSEFTFLRIYSHIDTSKEDFEVLKTVTNL